MGGANHTRVWVRSPGAGRDGVMDVGVGSGAASWRWPPRTFAGGRKDERKVWALGSLGGRHWLVNAPRRRVSLSRRRHSRAIPRRGIPGVAGVALQTRNRAGRAVLRGLWIARGTQAQKHGADGPARWLLSMMSGLPRGLRMCHLSHAVCTPSRPRCFSFIVSVREPCPEVIRREIEDRGIDS